MAIRWLRRTQVLAVCVAAAGCRAGPVAVDAPPRAAPAEVQLLLAGDQQLWIADVKAGTARRVRLSELSPGDPPTRIVRRGGAFVLWGSGTQLWEPSRETLSPLVRDSWFFLPSTADDRVWLAFLDLESPPTVRAIRAMREITVRGEVTVPDTRPPGGRWPIRAVRAGLPRGSGALARIARLRPSAGDRRPPFADDHGDRRVSRSARLPVYRLVVERSRRVPVGRRARPTARDHLVPARSCTRPACARHVRRLLRHGRLLADESAVHARARGACHGCVTSLADHAPFM